VRIAEAATLREETSPVFSSHHEVVWREVYDIAAMSDARDDGIGSDYLRLDSRPFCARWVVFTLPRLVLRFTHEDVASLHRICVPADKWLVFIPLRMRAGVRWDGCAVTPDCHVLCPPLSESLVYQAGRTEFAIVSIGASAAANLVVAIRRRLLRASAAQIIHPLPTEARALASELIDLRATLTSCPERITSDAVAQTESRLHSELNRCLRDAGIDRRMRHPLHSQASIVRRAEVFFQEHLGEAVSVSQLSTVVGVSERSLRNAFYQVCATGPKKYLRLRQLHQVRRTLRSAPNDHAAVTTAATRHGFSELGRFAVQYRTVFGEPPSATLHRARQTV
jgi:AraC-like DNA-binding protein